MGEPRTAREAMLAEMLGDIDGILTRIEALPAKIAAAELQLATSTATLDAAGDRYRMTICAFTDQAKEQVTSYLERKAGETAAHMLEDQRKELQEAVLQALAAIAEKNEGSQRRLWPRVTEALASPSWRQGSRRFL